MDRLKTEDLVVIGIIAYGILASKVLTTRAYMLVMINHDYYCIPEGEVTGGRVLMTGLSYDECNNLISSLYMI